MTLAMVGVIFLVLLEQMTIVALDMVGNLDDYPHELKEIGATTSIQVSESHIPSHNHIEIDEDYVNDGSRFKLFMKLIIFESAIAVHSIIIGFNLGILTDDDLAELKSLMIALAFHQFFEGFSLGTIISSIRNLPFAYNLLFSIIFSITTPIGIIIGLLTTNSAASDHAKGVANGLAGGFLIYAGLVEIRIEEFNKETTKEVRIQQIPLMCLSMVIGAAFMGILAIWA